MTDVIEKTEKSEPKSAPSNPAKKSWWHISGVLFLGLVVFLIAARIALPYYLKWYVNQTIDRSPLYDGEIGDIEVHLYRGAYTIKDIRIVKTTGNVPVPLYAASQVDLAIEWDALRHGKVVG